MPFLEHYMCWRSSQERYCSVSPGLLRKMIQRIPLLAEVYVKGTRLCFALWIRIAAFFLICFVLLCACSEDEESFVPNPRPAASASGSCGRFQLSGLPLGTRHPSSFDNCDSGEQKHTGQSSAVCKCNLKITRVLRGGILEMSEYLRWPQKYMNCPLAHIRLYKAGQFQSKCATQHILASPSLSPSVLPVWISWHVCNAI